MKKQLLAIAVSAATVAPMAAMAEAELYGRWDVSAQSSKSVNNAGGQQGGATPLVTNGRYNYAGGSNVGNHHELRSNKTWIGVRGDADLDHQLKAMYQLEMQFNPGLDTGPGNGPGFTLRNTYGGLGNDDWGKVFVGRYDSIIKQAEFSVDQFNHTDADMEVFLGNNGQARYDDTLNYHSPKIGPSIQVKLQFRPGESRMDTDDNSENDRETSLVDGMGISLGMEEGNMYGAIAYETAQQKFGPAGGGNVATTDLQTMRVTGGLDDDMFGVGILYEQQDSSDASDAYGDNADDSRSGWMLSGRYNVTEPLAIKAQYGTADTRVPGISSGTQVSNDNEQSIVSATLGADYSLGDQTKVYTFYSMNEVDGETDLDNDGNFDDESDAEFNVLAVGMEHRF